MTYVPTTATDLEVIQQLQRELAQARAEAAKYRAALEHVIEHLELRDDAEYIERLARGALGQDMTTEAPGAAPDVSSVLEAADGYMQLPNGHHETTGTTSRECVQQAAEQACYRYALECIDRCYEANGVTVAYERFRDERLRLRQLLAGRA